MIWFKGSETLRIGTRFHGGKTMREGEKEVQRAWQLVTTMNYSDIMWRHIDIFASFAGLLHL